MNSLIVLPNWVGDTVMALPVLEALAASGRRLTVLGRPHLESLLRSCSSLEGFLPRSPSDQETIRAVAGLAYDEAVVLPNSIRSAWLVAKAGIPRRWGYAGRSAEGWVRRFLLQPAVADRRRRKEHQVEDYAGLLQAMEVPQPASREPQLELPEASRTNGRQLLARAGIGQDAGPVVGLFAGAEFGPSKRWPWRRFAELARELRRQRPGCRFAILAGPKETWLAVRIHEESGKIHPVVGPDLDLGRLAEVISNLDLLVTNDSGPMHLAAALGVPTLALFGPTDPRRTSPLGAGHQVFYTDRWCSPCFRKRCPLLHHRCLRDITVETVTSRALQMLDGI